MFLVSEANFFSEKNTGFLSHSGHKTAAAVASDFGRQVGCGHGITMLMVEAVGIGGGGRVEGIGGGGKGKRNGRHQDDIVLVLVTKCVYIACPPFLLSLAWLSHPQIEEAVKV